MTATKNSTTKTKKLAPSLSRGNSSAPTESSVQRAKNGTARAKNDAVRTKSKTRPPANKAQSSPTKVPRAPISKPRESAVTSTPSTKRPGRGKSVKTLFKLEQRAVERTTPKILEAYESNDAEALKQINTTVPVVLPPPKGHVYKTMELMVEICFAIANGASSYKLCDQPRMPTMPTLYGWLAVDPVFRKMWDEAMQLRAEKLVEEILEIADDNSDDVDYTDEHGGPHINGENIARSKLKVDTRKWLASKLLPKKYGDKTILSGDDENPLQLQVTAMVASSDDLLKKIRGGVVEGSASEVVGK